MNACSCQLSLSQSTKQLIILHISNTLEELIQSATDHFHFHRPIVTCKHGLIATFTELSSNGEWQKVWHCNLNLCGKCSGICTSVVTAKPQRNAKCTCTIDCAQSFPESTAPSIEAKYFCFV